MEFKYNGKVESIELNKYSKTLTQDPTQPATQAMYYGIGFKDEDFKKLRSESSAWIGTEIPVTCTWGHLVVKSKILSIKLTD